MDDDRLGWAVRSLRHARGWRQTDLARRAGVSASAVALVESGQASRLTIRMVRLVGAAVGLNLRWDPGPAMPLARLRDADHAALAEDLARSLSAASWDHRAEVSYSRYGERGRIDILAFREQPGILLVVEVKSVVADVQALLGGLDAKVRLAPVIGRDLGWVGQAVVPLLLLAEGRTSRRRLAEHPALFARFAVRGRAARSWLRSPSAATSGLLMWATLPNHNHRDLRRAGRQRIRVSAPRPSVR